MLISWAIEGY
uniref:Uncharacterized protein n=1 Tax=Lepeophtheirus salmonis TaxID=72036 RepID=A0A0K2TRB2_LEPSM